MKIVLLTSYTRVSNPHPFHADPNPGFEINADPDEGFNVFKKFVFLP